MMKKHYKHLAVLGTLCCTAALAVLWLAVLTVDWVSIQEPQLDPLELDKLGQYEEPKPHLIRAKFGLFKMCIQQQHSLNLPSSKNSIGAVDSLVHNVNTNNNNVNMLSNVANTILNPNSHINVNSHNYGVGSSSSGTSMSPIHCIDLDWYNFGLINLDPNRKPPPMPTELIANCVEKLRFTLPFIGLSVLFTSISFLCLTFGYFCQKNKKIIEASLLILAGLCQATALLTFVSQIGSEFEANLPYSHHHKRLTTFYRYKYGYSFYLFLLSFSLSELAALFDMAAYFRKYPPNHYVITFHRQEPSPFMGTSSSTGGQQQQQHNNPGNTTHNHLQHNTNNSGGQQLTSSTYATDSLSSRTNHSTGLNNYTSNHNTYPNSNYNTNHLGHHHHTYSSNYTNSTLNSNAGSNSISTTLTKQQQQYVAQHGVAPPDLCNDYINNSSNTTGDGGHGQQLMDLTAIPPHRSIYQRLGGVDDLEQNISGGGNASSGSTTMIMPLPPPQSFMNTEVTITTIERNNGYGTLRNNKPPTSSAMESFGTMRKENNI